MKNYQITIAYRIYPGVSKSPFIHADNKLKLTETGIKTLKKSLGKKSAKIFFLLDNCPDEYVTMISGYFEQSDIVFIRYAGIGNLATFGKQIDILLEQTDSEVVMF
ncbi:glycosyltransferase family 2 protein, partial [Armatimonadetes bacterium]|nr:glycosyltransferase family 2 protein [bacterium]